MHESKIFVPSKFVILTALLFLFKLLLSWAKTTLNIIIMMQSILSSILQWINSFYKTSKVPKVVAKSVKSDAERSIPELIESRGFVSQTHLVVTPDGYELTLFRIVNPRSKSPKPVLMMHGFAGNCGNYITAADDGYLRDDDDLNATELDNTQGFLLAKRGYDVWLGSMRGSRYGMAHKTLSVDDTQFWQWTLDDIIEYDLVSQIEYILGVNGHNKMGYIGVSLGCTIMFGLLATKPKYNEIIRPFIALSPCYRLYHMRSPLKPLFRLTQLVWNVYPWYKPAFSHQTELKFQRLAKSKNLMTYYASVAGWWSGTLLGGSNWDQWDLSRINVYASHAAVLNFSMKQMMHSMQYTLRDKPFSKYDYGPQQNLALYGSVSPVTFLFATHDFGNRKRHQSMI